MCSFQTGIRQRGMIDSLDNIKTIFCLYYFFEDVYPIVAEIRGWRIKRWLEAPDFLKSLCGEYRNNINVAAEMAAAALLGEADDENDNNVVNNNQVVPNEE